MPDQKDHQLKAITETLSNIKLFEQLNPEELLLLAKCIKEIQIAKDHFVIKEDESGDRMFIIYKGEVEIIKNTLGGDSYTVTTLNDEHNAFFGELALIADDKRSASIKTLTDCTFFTICKDVFTRLGDENPKIGLLITRQIARILAERIRKSNSDVITLFEALLEEVDVDG